MTEALETFAPARSFAPERRFSPYAEFTRREWAALRDSTPLTLSEDDLDELQGINESLSMREVVEIYLPLSRLLNLHIAATQQLHQVTDTFLCGDSPGIPYVIGIAGSVAAGKSTTARILQALLSRWPEHPRVDLVTTDGFLLPNRVLEERGIMHRKGFPESYDVPRLLQFVADVKAGRSPVTAPVYSHFNYDIVPGEEQRVTSPDIMIMEGLNVLQSSARRPLVLSDFFDFSIYVDASDADLAEWFLDRFLELRRTAFRDPTSFFHTYVTLTEAEATRFAEGIWRDINLLNLKENIEPTRERAKLILEKGARHAVDAIRLRKV